MRKDHAEARGAIEVENRRLARRVYLSETGFQRQWFAAGDTGELGPFSTRDEALRALKEDMA